MKKFLLISIFLISALTIFSAGILVGNKYQVTDILCPVQGSETVLQRNFVSPEGIIFPKGVVVNLRNCNYMQRFNWEFAIEHQVNVGKSLETRGEVGFSVLAPGDEI